MKRRLLVCLVLVGLVVSLSAANSQPRPEYEVGTPTIVTDEYHGYIAGPYIHYRTWVGEYLDKKKLEQKNATRKDDNFHVDPKYKKNTSPGDYQSSGYDEGHQAPAADMEYSEEAMVDCFLVTNMMPQWPNVNRTKKCWAGLEQHVRSLVVDGKTQVWVFTGPAFVPDVEGKLHLHVIGSHSVWVPTHCFKAVMVRQGDVVGLMAWLVPNIENPPAWEKCGVSVDELEYATGFDFFSALPDDIEKKLEEKKPKG